MKKVKRLDSQERLSRARREQDRGAFLAEAASQGFAASVDARVRIESAGNFAEVLGVSTEDELCVRDRTQRADGKVVQLAVSRLGRSITAGTALEQVETGPGGAYARLAEAGYEPTTFEEIVGAGPATAEERRLLDVQVVLRVRRLACAGDRVVEVNDMTMPADSYELRYRFSAV